MPNLKNIRRPDGIVFTHSQEKALEKLSEWANSGASPDFTLKGYAGTGKTFILRYFLNEVYKKPVCVTAPTHKAVRVVERATGRTAKTLHSLHGLRPNVNLETFNIDNLTFDTLGNINMMNYSMIVIDECSQIGKSIYELNLRRAREYGVKVLYVGDPAQLPPINERSSRTFDVEESYTLTEIVRQAEDNPLLNLLSLLRTDVLTGGNNFLYHVYRFHNKINSKGEGYIGLAKDSFQTEILRYFKSDRFSSNVEYVRYTAWTKESVGLWNKFIRDNILDDSSMLINHNDLFTGYKTIVNEYNTAILVNSEDYMIDDITRRMTDYNFMSYVVTLKNMQTSALTVISIVDHKDASFVNFYKTIDVLHVKAMTAKGIERGKNWKRYFEFKERNLLLVDVPLYDGDTLRNTVQKDIDYGYGLTTHKLQGSTINNMFINVLDMCFYQGDKTKPIRNTRTNPHAVELRNKLMYTALSRASEIAVLLL